METRIIKINVLENRYGLLILGLKVAHSIDNFMGGFILQIYEERRQEYGMT